MKQSNVMYWTWGTHLQIKRELAAVIRCHLFHCAYHLTKAGEADAVSAISLWDHEMTLEQNAHSRIPWCADREGNAQSSQHTQKKGIGQVPVCLWSKDRHFQGKEGKKQDEEIKIAQVNSVNPTEKCRIFPLCAHACICTPALFYSMVLYKIVNASQMVHEVILPKKHHLCP